MLTFRDARWPERPPRRWQAEAFEAVRRHFARPAPGAAVISAIMGSGKTELVRELCACLELSRRSVVVVSTSTEHLVEDLHREIRRRCGTGRSVGLWYGRRKRLGNIIVACIPSVPALAEQLRAHSLSVALWVADEAHRTECTTVLTAYETLAPACALGVTATAFRSDRFESISLFDTLIYRYAVAQAQGDGVVVPWRLVHAHKGEELDATCANLVREAEGPGLANAVEIDDAEAFARRLAGEGTPAQAIHSRLAPRERRRRIELLRLGKLRALVHVNLLAEGANYPWLRWLLLRRKVESRVRFIQEIGRLLRSHPGKAEAVFYDPHDLFGSFELTYEEALGEPPEKPEWDEEIDPVTAARRIRESDAPTVLAWIESVIRTLVVACNVTGLLGARRKILGVERLKPSTPLQHAVLTRAIQKAAAVVPAGWRKCLEAVTARPECLRFGFAADLIAALGGIAKTGCWPPLDGSRRISAVPGTEPGRPFPAVVGRRGQVEIDIPALAH